MFFLKQLLLAIQYMHRNHVIHRDLKLGNLFLDKELNIKVGDLGLATILDDPSEKRQTICGTPNYIAPEVIQGDKSTRGHSFEVDVWSMGVILYTLLVGKPPYEAKDVKATYQRILHNQYSFPPHIPLSDNVKDLIRTLLQSNPSDRPSLDTIAKHPFLNDPACPIRLPSQALHLAPQQQSRKVLAQRDTNVMVDNDNASKGTTKLSVRDPPPALRPRSSPKKVVAVAKKPVGFEIFDDLMARTKALSLQGTAPPSPSVASSVYSSDPDQEILVRLMDHCANLLRRKRPAAPLAQGGPSVWVSRYVDYTTKYGLGFLMSDGSSGVYFNDSTKMASSGETVRYMERQRDDLGRLETLTETHTLSHYPERLKKKVTLLQHFSNYLRQQQQQNDHGTSLAPSACALVFVKKWIRTKHAILFRLSNHTVQVVFFDQTEVLVTLDDVTFVDKERNRTTYADVGSRPELAKRLQYTLEILEQLRR